MLTEKQIELLGDEFVPLFQKLEQDVIHDIIRRVGKTGRWTETAELQAKALQELGYSPQEIKRKVLDIINVDDDFKRSIDKATIEYKKRIAKKIEKTVEEAKKKGDELTAKAGDMAFNNDLKLWQSGGKTLYKTGTLKKTINFYKKQTLKHTKNITGSMGFVIDGKGVKVKEAFTNELNEAIIKVASGAFTKEQATESIVRRLSESGLRKIDFKSGASRNIDTAARLAIQTTHAQLSASIMLDNLKETNTDLVEVSHHSGARNEGIGCANHASWQGKVYSLSGRQYPEESQRLGYKIEKLADITGYPDDPAGLCGFNCRHTFYAFFEGISEPNEPEKEREPFIWNGNEYDHYKARQKQRQIEREIRALKRAKASGVEKLEARIVNKHIEYRRFCEAGNLTINRGRLSIYNVKEYTPYLITKKTASTLKPKVENYVEVKKVEVLKPKKQKSTKKKDKVATDIPKTLMTFDAHSKTYYDTYIRDRITETEAQQFSKTMKNIMDNSEYSMRFKSKNLDALLTDGVLKNQFETGTSGGTVHAGYRRSASKNLFGHTGKGFKRKDYEKYGYMAHKDFYQDWRFNIDETRAGVSQYGDIIIRFNPQKVKNRTTITFDNSLGPAVNEATIATTPLNPTVNGIDRNYLEDILEKVKRTKPKDIHEATDSLMARYVETQYHGSLTLNDVSDMCFTEVLPDDNILEKLKTYGIKLWRIEGYGAIEI